MNDKIINLKKDKLNSKFVFTFGKGSAEGTVNDKNLLGGKGANLAEMTNLGIPVPPGFTVSTDVCAFFMNNNSYPENLKPQVLESIHSIEKIMGQLFGNPENPLLVSIRSGARQSMPGMMETVLNVGLTKKTITGLINKTGNPRFVYDAYRRLITMYSDVVMEKAAGIEPKEGAGIREQLEQILESQKSNSGLKNDTDLTEQDLKEICRNYKLKIKEVLGNEFPENPMDQLWGGIGAVFSSWNGKRAINYRKIEEIPDIWGTAVNVQAMVFGNMGDTSATGVAFTRNPATGENCFYGEWLSNAQGEDVVAGIRTPNPLNLKTKTNGEKQSVSLEEVHPEIYYQLDDIQKKLESHYRDMQDIEFTIQEDRLWMLQTRTGKRNGAAAIRIAMEMLSDGMISEQEALMRIKPEQLDEIMHPAIDPELEKKSIVLCRGLPAGPGGAVGQIVFNADDAEVWKSHGKQVILVRKETSPEDVHGMHAANAILTARGGMTSHAALVARGWGKCCIVGCNDLQINAAAKTVHIGTTLLKEGDWITLNGSTGRVYEGKFELILPDFEANTHYRQLMKIADNHRTLGIRTNAERPVDSLKARKFGAEGIGLCRTEHMFFEPERIINVRKMILAENEEDRKKAVMKLLPFQKQDFKEILKTMSPFPVTIRLLDPPLHEFMDLNDEQIEVLAQELHVTPEKIKLRISTLHESNPMLGHRGCRLGIAYSEITQMQARAIFEAASELRVENVSSFPEIMIPLVGNASELKHQRALVQETANKVIMENGLKIEYLIGTMIELPRACVTADEIAEWADFFSFGTNDLTQTTFGFSRDDINGFLPLYLDNKILPSDPFQTIDTKGVGALVKEGVNKGRNCKGKLKIGICGEHGGDPDSITFFHETGLDYVSCSPYRIPIARLAAAQAAL